MPHPKSLQRKLAKGAPPALRAVIAQSPCRVIRMDDDGRALLDFEVWWKELVALAGYHRLLFLLDDRDSHRQAWIDGLKPQEELLEQLDAAWKSC